MDDDESPEQVLDDAGAPSGGGIPSDEGVGGNDTPDQSGGGEETGAPEQEGIPQQGEQADQGEPQGVQVASNEQGDVQSDAQPPRSKALMDHLTGANAMHPDDFKRGLSDANPDGSLDLNVAHLKAIANEQDPNAAEARIQRGRVIYDEALNHAKVAAEQGHMNRVADYLNMGTSFIPNDTKLTADPTNDGLVINAQDVGTNNPPETFMIPNDQVAALLHSPDVRFDMAMKDDGWGNILASKYGPKTEENANGQGPPEQTTQPGQGAPIPQQAQATPQDQREDEQADKEAEGSYPPGTEYRQDKKGVIYARSPDGQMVKYGDPMQPVRPQQPQQAPQPQQPQQPPRRAVPQPAPAEARQPQKPVRVIYGNDTPEGNARVTQQIPRGAGSGQPNEGAAGGGTSGDVDGGEGSSGGGGGSHGGGGRRRRRGGGGGGGGGSKGAALKRGPGSRGGRKGAHGRPLMRDPDTGELREMSVEEWEREKFKGAEERESVKDKLEDEKQDEADEKDPKAWPKEIQEKMQDVIDDAAENLKDTDKSYEPEQGWKEWLEDKIKSWIPGQKSENEEGGDQETQTAGGEGIPEPDNDAGGGRGETQTAGGGEGDTEVA